MFEPAERFDLEVKVDLESDHNFYTGLTQNISSGGLFIATHHLRRIGDRDHAEVHVAGVGEDARCGDGGALDPRELRAPSHRRRRTGMGVRFINLSPETSAAINAFVAGRESLYYDDEDSREALIPYRRARPPTGGVEGTGAECALSPGRITPPMGDGAAQIPGIGWESLTLSFASLGVVCLVAWGTLRLLAGRGVGKASGAIRVVARCPLEPRRSVVRDRDGGALLPGGRRRRADGAARRAGRRQAAQAAGERRDALHADVLARVLRRRTTRARPPSRR